MTAATGRATARAALDELLVSLKVEPSDECAAIGALVLERILARTAARAITEFADAHRLPVEWVMFRDGDHGVTVTELLRETAARIRTDAGLTGGPR